MGLKFLTVLPLAVATRRSRAYLTRDRAAYRDVPSKYGRREHVHISVRKRCRYDGPDRRLVLGK